MEDEITKPYIVTDPSYILEDEEYDNIPNRKQQDYPFNSTGKNKQLIVMYKSENTCNGDGAITYNDQEVSVDSGQLCLAYCKDGWKDETVGALFNTLYQAKDAYYQIIRKF